MQKMVKIIVGSAQNNDINPVAEKFIRQLVIIFSIFKIKIMVISCGGNNLKYYSESIRIDDAANLFDFSRYEKIIKSIDGNPILFLFNDTLGNGRHLKIGCKLYIFFSIIILLISNRCNLLFSPIDSDAHRRWVSPYFMIGRVSLFKMIDFVGWRALSQNFTKSERRQMWCWLHTGWRNSNLVNSKIKRIKYRTLIIEKSILNNIKKPVWGYSKYSILRLVNSIHAKLCK